MFESTEIVKKKCGQIFILSNGNLSLICDCEFCGCDFDTLEGFRAHITEHFPISPTHIKKEESISCGSDRESISSELREDVQEDYFYNHNLQDDPNSKSFADRFCSSELVDDGDQSKINQTNRIRELRSNSEKIVAHSTRGIDNCVALPKSKICSSTRNTKNLECRFCSKVFKIKRDRNNHENIHTGKRPHQCQICFRTFHGSSALWSHNNSHTDRRHKCSSCEKKFVTKALCDVHTRENHLPDTDPRRYFSCKKCETKFKNHSQLARHRQTHRKNTPTFTCDYCQKQTTRKSNMEVHVRIHSGTKPYKCNYCVMGFASNSGRRRHEQKTCPNNN